MTLVDLLHSPLQQLADYVFSTYREYDEQCHENNSDASWDTCVSCHQKAYWRNGKPKYNCDNLKKVYLWRYLSTHIAQTEPPLLRPAAEKLCGKEEVKAMSVGGGPGTEAIALINQLNNSVDFQNITFHNLEFEQSWESIYFDLVMLFTKFVDNISITPAFLQFDASAPLIQIISESDYDIVFLPWILSEMKTSGERRILIQRAIDATCPEGFTLITDRIEEALIEDISSFVNGLADCNLIEVNKECVSYAGISFPPDLVEIFKPKLNYRTAYWVLQKN